MLHDTVSPPEFMTCGELVRQDDRYIREYAALYGIPDDVSRSEMLERIYLLNPGSDACIPVLKHFTAERGNDGRVRLTGRVSPTPESPKALRVVPAGRRLARESASKHVLNDISQQRKPAASRAPSSSESSASPGPSDRPPSPKATPPPEEVSIIPEEVNPARRFPTPFDTYSPGPSSPGLDSGGSRSSRQGSPSVKPVMEFVYPPRPRPLRKGGNGAGASDREHSPGPNWLHKMLIDVQRGRVDLNSELEALTREANDAAGEIMKLQVLRDKEAKEMHKFLDDLRKIVGPEVVQGIIDDATEAAEERTSDEGEDDESGKGGSDSDSQKTDSESSSSHNDSDGGEGHAHEREDGDSEDQAEDSKDAESSKNRSEDENQASVDEDVDDHEERANDGGDHGEQSIGSIFGHIPPVYSWDRGNENVPLRSPPPEEFPENLTSTSRCFTPRGQPFRKPGDDKWSRPTETAAPKEVISDNLFVGHLSPRQDSGEASNVIDQAKIARAKRSAYFDPDSDSSSRKRAKLADDREASPPRVETPQTPPSPSRKRARDSDGSEDSAWEVEESVRLTGDESSSGGPRKKPRSDIDACTSPSSPRPSRKECGSSRSSESFSSESGSESNSDSDDAPDEGDLSPVLWKDFLTPSEDSDDSDDASYLTTSEVESEDDLEYEVERDEPSLSLSSESRSYDEDDDENDGRWSPVEPADLHPPNDGSLGPSPPSPNPSRFGSRLPPLGSMPWPEPSAATSQPAVGPSSRPVGGPSLWSQSASSQSSIEDSPPTAGPSNPHQRPRVLMRARERLRPTASGNVEAYVYDEGSDYEHRLEREAQTLAAWRRYNATRSTYPFQQEFDVIRGALNVPLVTFADDEEEGEEEENAEGATSKGKGKEKA